MIVRFTSRVTLWEKPPLDLDEIVETEFKPWRSDFLTPSVYEIESAEHVVRICTEHAASIPLDPPKGAAVDLSGREARAKLGESRYFEFARQNHRELAFLDEADLRNFIATIEGIEARLYRVSRRELKEFARQKINNGDPEWSAFCRESLGARSWGCPTAR